MRRDLLMLLVLITWSVLMMLSATFKVDDGSGIAGITKNPGVAMEFARFPQDVVGLLGDPHAGDASVAQTAVYNRKVMKRQQYLDFVFIALYWMFFVFVISAVMRKALAWLGWLVAILISLTAVADILEDIAILSAVRIPQGSLLPFEFGVAKWFLFFAALGVSSLLLLLYPRCGVFPVAFATWTNWPRLVAGAAFLGGSLLGVTAVIGALRGQGSLFAGAELALLIGFLSLLVLFLTGAGLFAKSLPQEQRAP